tara:strand:- start:313 stop:573 length:261 start_codon:yes stop_codon:yes gene_type:complete
MGRVKTHGRAERKKSAEERQQYYNTLTPQEKLDRLPPEGAKKQRVKLEYQLKFGRKTNEASTPSATKKRKDAKPSRKERWETRQKN